VWLIAGIVTLFAFPNLIFGQNLSVQGRVADPQGNAIFRAEVSITSVNDKNVRRTLTGTEGQFYFTNLEPGNYGIKVVVSGFEPATRTLLIGDTEPLIVNIQLKIALNQQTVTVTTDVKEGDVLAPDPA
jgi:hypothetical protein